MAVQHLRRAAIVVVLLVGAFAIARADAAPSAGARAVGLERGLIAAVNEARAARGLRPLRVSPALRAVALAHSRAMLAGGFFTHESADGTSFSARLEKAYPRPRYGRWMIGENLFATSAPPAPAAALEAWLASPPHRGIVLSPHFRDVGIGFVRSPSAGGAFGGQPTWVVTADFGARIVRR